MWEIQKSKRYIINIPCNIRGVYHWGIHTLYPDLFPNQIPEPRFEPRLLPFRCLSIEEIVALPENGIKRHVYLNNMYVF